MIKLACRRFRRLVHRDSEDRSASQNAFMESHRASCRSCESIASTASDSMAFFRGLAMDAEVSPYFDSHIQRKHRVATLRQARNYLLPYAVGACVAAAAVLALLQIVTLPMSNPDTARPLGEARLDTRSQLIFPNLESVPNKPRVP